ncbi:N-methyl-L-tryptophan oxidase [Mesobacillus maritimus]|uniref:N-methyl-L-tryptophan oxidase n=1 Tax=Mesobacillus maritimus TaxID=1643336 RepID=UPI00384E0BD5
MDAEVAVIGVGTMGSMAMWQLARRGVSVVGFEQFGIGHDRSAAGGESRAFRTAYLEGSEYVPLLQEAKNQWVELEKDSGSHLLTLNGGLMIGNETNPSMRNILQCIKEFKLDHEVLEGESARKRYPQHPLRSGELMVLDKQAGFIKPELSVLAAARKAEELGSKIYRYSRVESVSTHAGGVTVVANNQTYLFEKVVITAGPWLDYVLPNYKENFEVNRLLLAWFAAKDINLFTPERFPIFVRLNDEINLFGVPTLDGNMVKLAPVTGHGDGLIQDPDNVDRNVRVEDLKSLIDGVAKYLPDIIPEPIRVSAYMDGFTTDHHPVVGFAPEHENVVVLGGFSGHGFKMAPVMGKIAADLVINGRTQHHIQHLNPNRFTSAKI